MTRRYVVPALLLTFVIVLAIPALAQGQGQGKDKWDSYYDTFSETWLDPAKWIPGAPNATPASILECIREIQDGRLRLEARNIGDTSSDSGFQYSDNDVRFTNPNEINSMTVDVTLGRVNVVGCPTNDGQPTTTVVKITGNFFNTGSGLPEDDVSNDLYLWVDTTNPENMIVGDWVGRLNVGANLGTYPIGTTLTVTNSWDKENHQFVSVAMIKGHPKSAKRVAVPYDPLLGATPPANPVRLFNNMLYSANCSSVQTFAEVEAFFDNVKINDAPPPTP